MPTQPDRNRLTAPVEPEIAPGGEDALPTRGMKWQDFEDFTERVLSAHRFCVDEVKHVTRIQRWGRPGDKQDGIDFEGTWSDGTSVAWQCKRQKSLTVTNVDEIVDACTFEADSYYLTFSDAASADVKKHIKKYPKWAILDRDGLRTLLDDLPLHRQRQVLDATWGIAYRKRLLRSPGEDAFLLPSAAADLRNARDLLNDAGPLAGRKDEIERIVNFVDDPKVRVVVVNGPGGRGKSRVLIESLIRLQQEHLSRPVLVLSQGRGIDRTALEELPYTPAVIAVDDAHLSLSTQALLHTYAQATLGTKLIFTTRPSYIRDLRSGLAASGFDQVEEVVLEPLERKQAVELVHSLSTDLDLTYAFESHLAQQAAHSPHVAVLALNLIRTNELTAFHLLRSDDLRQAVMNRYRDIETESIGDCSSAIVRKALATYAAVGPLSVRENKELLQSIADYCGLTKLELLTLLEKLAERGVLLHGDSTIQVIPEVLSDEIIGQQAVVAGYDTGFVTEIWSSFGSRNTKRILNKFAELDARITTESGHTVLEACWSNIVEDVLGSDRDGMAHALSQLDVFARLQPVRTNQLLVAIHGRVEAGTLTDVEPPSRGALTHDALGQVARRHFNISTPTDVDIEDRLSHLYGQCARADTRLLEATLNGLWKICVNRNKESAIPKSVTSAVDEFANLRRVADATVPIRIADWVNRCIAQTEVGADPTFAVGPLLAKEGGDVVQTAALEVSLRPYQISPQTTRDLRDHLRNVLLTLGRSGDPRLVGISLGHLEHALRRPHGQFGSKVPDSVVLGWQDDDLATLTVLSMIACGTPNAAARRQTRHIIAWHAEHAKSVQLRYAALELATELDQIVTDDLTELILNEYRLSMQSQRGSTVPDFETYQRKLSEQHPEGGLTAGNAESLFDVKEDRKQQFLEHTVGKIYEEGGASGLLDSITSATEDIVRLLPRHHPNLWRICRYIADTIPDAASVLVTSIGEQSPSVMDTHIGPLLETWSHVNESELLAWLQSDEPRTDAIRLQVARAFDSYDWVTRGQPFLELHRNGLHDSETEIRDTYLVACHPLIRLTPCTAVKQFIGPDVLAEQVQHILDRVAGTDGAPWGESLKLDDATAIIHLCLRTTLKEWTVEQLLSGIARTHPKQVLLELAQTLTQNPGLMVELPELPTGLADHPDVITELIIEESLGGQRRPTLIAIALGNGLSDEQAQSIGRAILPATVGRLKAVLRALSNLATWPLQQPLLAEQMLQLADAISPVVANSVLSSITEATHVSHFGWTNGTSEELDRAATLASKALDYNVTDARLRLVLSNFVAWCAQESAQIAKRFDDEFDA